MLRIRAVRLRLATCVAFLVFAGCSKDSGATGPTDLPSTVGTLVADPAQAELSVSDISRFWAAYDAYQQSKSANVFQTDYLQRASSGLVDFIARRSITSTSLAQMVSAYPRYFAGSRAVSLSLAGGAIDAPIRAGFAAIKVLYPDAVFPTVTFAIGRFSTAGTIANNRILIGAEFFMANAGVPTDELQPFQQVNVKPMSALPIVVAHEHVHILQSRRGGIIGRPTLLEQALSEGIADFVGELASGGNINAWQQPYGIAHERELWTQFQSQMNGTDVSQWLYNQGTATGERPGDLGYFIGYRIAKAYYAKTTDKTQAIKDIIEVQNAAAFLAASGYSPQP